MDAREVFLAHHGILGQKWGRKNGPPYPLDASDKAKAARKKSKEQYKRDLADVGAELVNQHLN